MKEDLRNDLIEDIIEGIAHGDVADSLPAFRIERGVDGSITVDLGEPHRAYVVTVAEVERSSI